MNAVNEDALELIRSAILRGASQLNLVRAAVACACAVAPLVSAGNADVVAAVEATERWPTNPCELNATTALVQCNIDNGHATDSLGVWQPNA